MNRRPFLGAAVALTAPVARVGWAQPAARVYRIGYLASGAAVPASRDALLHGFLARLDALGYAEGRNLIVERRTTEGQNERYRVLAADLVGLRVDLIVAPGTAAALAAREVTRTIPIVTVVAGDPVGSGLATSLARPGGNVTGTMSSGAEVVPKQLQLMREILPNLDRLAVLSLRTSLLHRAILKDLDAAAHGMHVSVRPVDIRNPQDLDGALSAIARERPDALIPLDDPLTFQARQRISDFALRQRLPTGSGQRTYAESGMLFSYGPNFLDLFQRAASFVDRILKGAKPSDLPIEQPTKFELIINLKTAHALGVKIPSPMLVRADQVID